MRQRVSVARENRIWALRCQGYDYDTIARLTNVTPSVITAVIRRVRQRPDDDPIRCGRYHSWMSDQQVADIKARYAAGERQHTIALRYRTSQPTISGIINGKAYGTTEAELSEPYPWDFSNRLSRQRAGAFANRLAA